MGSWRLCLRRKAGSIMESRIFTTTFSTLVVWRRNCILVLIVSRGWQQEDSTRPAQPPATKCIKGFFFLLASLEEADMVKRYIW